MNHLRNGSFKKQAVLLGSAQDIGYGHQRTRLEDRLLVEHVVTKGGMSLSLGVIADGVGGANAGERAAEIVVETVKNVFWSTQDTDINHIIQQVFLNAQQMVREESKSDAKLRAMSTTATLAVIYQRKLYLGHVGDSRAYLVREHKIKQLTLDHSWGDEKIREGVFTADEINRNPRRDELARYIGQPTPFVVDIGVHLSEDIRANDFMQDGFPLREGDVVILCSDGLIKERNQESGHFVEVEEIIHTISRKQNAPQDVANTLVSLALGRKTDDNVSVVVMEIPERESVIATPPKKVNKLLWILGSLLFIFGVFSSFLSQGPNGPRPTPSPNSTNTPSIGFMPSLNATNTQPAKEFIEITNFNGEVYWEGAEGDENRPALGLRIPLDPQATIWTGGGRANNVSLRAANGNQIILGYDTRIMVGKMDVLSEGYLLLERGFLLLSGVDVWLEAYQRSFSVHLINGVMGISYAPETGDLLVDCLAGECKLGDGTKEAGFYAGQRLIIQAGVMLENFPEAQYDFWMALAPHFVPTPTLTPSLTPTEAPTATHTPTPTVIHPTRTPTPTPTKIKNQDPEPPDPEPCIPDPQNSENDCK